MLYPNLEFPKIKGRPFFYTNFVQTVDGKVQVLEKTGDYWPIGSKEDHDVLVELRSHADVLIHGKNLAKEFGEITLKSLNNSSFKKRRVSLGKNLSLPYYVVTKHPLELQFLRGELNIVDSNLKLLAKNLYQAGYRNILIEGGPHLLASFLKENLVDQIFLTIAPKVFGNKNSSTLTLVEGYLFPKKAIKILTLLSVKKVGNELFLRYTVGN